MNARVISGWVVGALVLQACGVQQLSVGDHDAGLVEPTNEVSGRFCTSPFDRSEFGVKVVLLVENSLSQCAVDPGATPDGGSGACPRLPLGGPTAAARTRLIRELQARSMQSAQTSVLFHLVPFADQQLELRPEDFISADLALRAQELPADATGASDYEGALTYGLDVIARDLERTHQQAPAALARTRYVVVLVGSGLPGARCGMGADAPGDLAGGWSSLDATQCAGRFQGLPRNQPKRLLELAADLQKLGDRYRSSVRLHTVQLFDAPGLEACGAACERAQPWRAPPTGRPWTPREQVETGRALMAALAQAGGGTLTQAVTAPELAAVAVPPAVTESALSLSVLKSLVLVPMSSIQGPDGPVVDSDGDGLANADEPDSSPSSRFAWLPDRDGDCFSDGLEARLARSHGFDPSTPDPRGCIPSSPQTLACACNDQDGDGLSDFEESYFGSGSLAEATDGVVGMDFDGDGLPDGVELAALMRPDQRLPPARDTDGDAVTDHDEVLALTDPQVPDSVARRRHAVSTQLTVVLGGESLPEGRTCYDFAIRNVPMVDTPAPPWMPPEGKTGWNRFVLYAGEAPQSVAALDSGRWRAACAWLRKSPTGEGVSLVLEDANFIEPKRALSPDTACGAVVPP